MRMKLMSHVAPFAALMMVAGPAAAEGKADRARAAIAEAQGKIDAVNTMGASGEVPRMVADAMAALRSAQDNLKGGKKDQSISDALHASQLADTAIGVAQKARTDAAAAQQAAQAADANAAMQAQAAASQDQVAAAQQQADAANARAANAERAASSAAADAAAARDAAAASTTVTTETTRATATPARPTVKKRVVHRATKRVVRAPAATEKTTTTVTTTSGSH